MGENFAANLPLSPNQFAAITPDMPVPQAVRLVCQVELATLEEMLPSALRGEDIEGVHKVRVTIRRLRTCLKFGKPYFKKKAIQSLRTDLQEVGQVFGKVRDLDVLKFSFHQFTTGEDIHPEFDQQIWMPAFGRIYADSRAAMRNCVEGQFFTGLRGRLNDFLLSDYFLKSEMKRAELPGSLREYLAPILKEQLAAMLEFRTSHENPPPYAEFHNLRLLAKAHRYTLEFFQTALHPNPAAASIESLVALQDHLGELNDSVVAEKLLQHIKKEELSPALSHAVAEFSAYKSAQRQVLTESFEQVWMNYRNLDPVARLSAALQP